MEEVVVIRKVIMHMIVEGHTAVTRMRSPNHHRPSFVQDHKRWGFIENLKECRIQKLLYEGISAL